MSFDENLKTAVEQIAKVKIAEALDGESDILSKIIEEVMNYKNRSYGRSERTFLDQMVHDVVGSVIRDEVTAFIAKDEDFRTRVREAVADKAATFTITVLDAFDKDDWRAQLDVKIERSE